MKRALAWIVIAAACRHGTRGTLHVPDNGDPHARQRFLDAQSKFAGNAKVFEDIVAEYPDDPIVPNAELEAGKAALKARDFADADRQLSKIKTADPVMSQRARMLLGIAKNYEGDAAAARQLLAGTDGAWEDEAQHTEWIAAVAYASAAGGDLAVALRKFDELWDRVSAAERAAILDRVEEVVAAAPPEALAHGFDGLTGNGPSVAVAGSRLVLILEQDGKASDAKSMRDRVAPARAAVGLPRTISTVTAGPATPTNGQAGLVGAILPLTSPNNAQIAEKAVAGMGLAAGAPGGGGVVAIETRAANDKAQAAAAVDELFGRNVIAIIGPISDGVDAATARADGLGVPILTLSPHPEQRSTGHFVFHLRHSPESRARTLAKRALALGIRTFAVMAPDSPYGKDTTAAFVAEIEHGAGKIVSTVTYAKGTKSFAGEVKKLTGGWDAIFVADEAVELGLLVPALDAAGMNPRPPGTKKVKGMTKGNRPVVLLSTAEDLTSAYLNAAGRHSEGALLAPGFYPDDAYPATQPFIARFVASYGHVPGATEAYAYDAAQLAAAAGTGGRAALAQTLGQSQLGGVTGAIRFDKDHRRADPGLVYTVVQETAGWQIRVAP